MNTGVPQNNDEQEIDLAQISKKINNFFERINTSIFRGIQFFVRNWIIVLILVVVGFGVGIFLDKTQKHYDNKIIVTPNFESVDYLYNKIDLIQSKILTGDTIFLKNTVGINNSSILKKIEIKPINDAVKFIEKKEQNFELIKLMAETSDVNKVLENDIISKNYMHHVISFSTNRLASNKEIVQPILNYLNNSEYYNKIQKVTVQNVQYKMNQNDSIISQINTLLNGFSNSINGSQKNDKLVYYNENTQLNDVIKTKDALINEQSYHRIELIGFDKIIKDNSSTLNIKNQKMVNGKLKVVLPILFVFLFVFFYFFKAFYRKQSLKSIEKF